MKRLLTYSMLIIGLVIYSCGGSDGDDPQPDPCAVPVVVTISSQADASNGGADGTVTVNATGGNGGYEYSISGTFQSSGTFSGLAPGNYTVTARDSEGCTGSVAVTIGEEAPAEVPSFMNDVMPILQARCSTTGCHVSGGSAPFVITGFADVSGRTGSIRARVSGRTMPPASSPSLTDAQIATIVDWIDGGAPNN